LAYKAFFVLSECIWQLPDHAPPPRAGDIKRWCASDVCLSRTSGLSREQED